MRGVSVSTAVDASNRLTASWAQTHTAGNTVFSGLGCWVLLSVLASGANGETRSELERAVGLEADRCLDGAGLVLSLMESIPSVQAALGVWTRVVLDPGWLEGLPSGVVGGLTDDPEQDQRRIDRWVAERTGGELSRLPIDISPDVLLLLANALTMQTDWFDPFTEAGAFRTGAWAGRPVERLVVSTVDLTRLRVVDTPAGPVTMVRIPGAEEIDVHLVLGDPNARAGHVLAGAVLAADAEDRIGEELGAGRSAPGVEITRVRATEPGDRLRIEACGFDLRSSHDLLTFKHIFGLESATDRSRGHFAGISPTPLAVDRARQEATATFNRTGFRATAVTAVSLGVGSARPSAEHRVRRVDVTFDRPFGFLARHRRSGLVLVAGWVDDPIGRTAAEGSS